MLEHRLVLFTDISIEYLHAVKAIVFGCENFSISVYKPIIKSGIYFVKTKCSENSKSMFWIDKF